MPGTTGTRRGPLESPSVPDRACGCAATLQTKRNTPRGRGAHGESRLDRKVYGLHTIAQGMEQKSEERTRETTMRSARAMPRAPRFTCFMMLHLRSQQIQLGALRHLGVGSRLV